MEANAAGTGRVSHVLTSCQKVVLSGRAHEDPTNVVDDGAAWLARWRGVVVGHGGAASISGACLQNNVQWC